MSSTTIGFLIERLMQLIDWLLVTSVHVSVIEFHFFKVGADKDVAHLLSSHHQVAYDSRSHLRAPGLSSSLTGSSGGKP